MDRFVYHKCAQMDKTASEGGESSQAFSVFLFFFSVLVAVENLEAPGTEQGQQEDDEGQLSALFADKSGLDNDISSQPCEGPRQSVLQKYPPRLFGNQQRSLNKSWIDQYTVCPKMQRLLFLSVFLEKEPGVSHGASFYPQWL